METSAYTTTVAERPVQPYWHDSVEVRQVDLVAVHPAFEGIAAAPQTS